MKPSELYNQDIQANRSIADSSQRQVLEVLDKLYEALEAPSKSLWPFVKRPELQGVYIYGQVGRGKTYLMDLFFASLTIPKLRLHFYAFMNQIHVELKMLQGQVNPLQKVVEQFARQAKVFCLDEFFVESIADAMILASLLDGLIKAEVVVVTTSNLNPQDLYREGLQRDRFLPAIDLIQKHLQILNLVHPTDYRLLHDVRDSHPHSLPGRYEACLSFHELCEEAKGSINYLSLTEKYQRIRIQNIPQLTEDNNDAVRRFITLVDIAYDRHVAIVLEMDRPLTALYQGKRLAFEFERTLSRLTEMAE